MAPFLDDRIKSILSRLQGIGFNPDDYATDGFDAVLVHVNGIMISANQVAIDLGKYDGLDDIIGRNALVMIEKSSFSEVIQRITADDCSPYKAVLLAKDGAHLSMILRPEQISVGGDIVRIISGKLEK